MIIHSFADLVNLLASFLSLFFAIYLLNLKSKSQLSNRLIGCYLLIHAIDSAAVVSEQFIFPNYPGLGLFINTSLFISPPLLYFYILSLSQQDFKLKPRYLLHLIPYLLAILLLTPRFYLVSHEAKIQLLSASEYIILELKLVYLLLHLQLMAYILATYLVIRKSKKLLLENYAFGNVNFYNWQLTLISLISLEIVLSTFKNVFLLYALDREYELATTITSLSALLFICWLVLKALQLPELYGRVDYKQPLVKQLVAKSVKQHDSQENEQNVVIRRIRVHMLQKEPFTDSSLSIYALAKQLGMPVKELSILINHHLNQHFFDFINEYRIKKAMKFLSDPEKEKLTILEILYEVGFNSKSSFNTAFKKYTKMTPSQYREKHKE